MALTVSRNFLKASSCFHRSPAASPQMLKRSGLGNSLLGNQGFEFSLPLFSNDETGFFRRFGIRNLSSLPTEPFPSEAEFLAPSALANTTPLKIPDGMCFLGSDPPNKVIKISAVRYRGDQFSIESF